MPSNGQAELDADLALIAAAEANGFMATLAIRNGLGWDKPKPNGSWYSSMEVAYRWIRDAGEDVVYLLPDGPAYYVDGYRKTIAKAKRTGVYADAFARVLAYKETYYARLRHDEWTRNMDQAVKFRDQYGDSGNMNWTEHIESLGPEPAGARRRRGRRPSRSARPSRPQARKSASSRPCGDYTGPMNRRGNYPKGPFMGLRGKAKRELWDRRNA